MTVKTRAQLAAQFDEIRNETGAGANTKARISDAYQDLADSAVEVNGSPVNSIVTDETLVTVGGQVSVSKPNSPTSVAGGGLARSRNNPIIAPYCMEISYSLEGTRLHAWYRADADLIYAYSDDPDSEVWTIGNAGQPISATSPTLAGVELIYVNKVGAVYYMNGKKPDGNMYLWRSADKVTWTAANGGNPIYTHSATGTDWDYLIYNFGIAVIGNTWHALIESKTSTENAGVGYSYGVFDPVTETINLTTNRSANVVFPKTGTGCPWLTYVAERSALMCVYSSIEIGYGVIRAARCDLADNPALAASWQKSELFALRTPGVILADPSVVFATAGSNKNWGVLLGYNYDQLSGCQAYGTTKEPAEFYDSIFGLNTAEAPDISAGTVRAGAIELGGLQQSTVTGGPNGELQLDSEQVAASSLISLTMQVHRDYTGAANLHAYGHVKAPTGTGTCTTQYAWISDPEAGFWGIGTSAPTEQLHVRRNGSGNRRVALFENVSGNVNVELVSGSKALALWSSGVGDFRLYGAGTPGTLGTHILYLSETGVMCIGGTTPNAYAQLDIQSTTKAFIPPRMTTTQRDAMTAAEGMVISNTTTHTLQHYNGTTWVSL